MTMNKQLKMTLAIFNETLLANSVYNSGKAGQKQ